LNTNLDYNGNKGFRLLSTYERLSKGEMLKKEPLADEYGVSLKTIQRDIDDLRAYLADTHFLEAEASIKYDKIKGGYYLVRFEREWLTNQEVLAICKILLESRAFQKDELSGLFNKLITQVPLIDKKAVEDIIRNEYFYYVPLKHNKQLLSPIWELSEFIIKQEIVSFTYKRQDDKIKERLVKPVAIMFSEYYFYLIAFMADESKDFPAVFRIDRIDNLKGTTEKFDIPYKDRFNDGEFRKRVQFMYPGKLINVKFYFNGNSLEAVLDRIPTAKVIGRDGDKYIVEAQVFGKGIIRWFLSQKDGLEVISPQYLRDEIKVEIEKMVKLYERIL
jgi:predicted DNA-binding transcriptional regulator YafY